MNRLAVSARKIGHKITGNAKTEQNLRNIRNQSAALISYDDDWPEIVSHF